MRLRRPIAFILSAAVAASALTGCDSFSGHAAAAANSAQVQQLIEFIADLSLERDLRQALQNGGDLRQALLTLLGLESAVNFNVDGLAGARPGQHAVQVWEVTAQSAEDAAALAASQIRAVLEQLKSSGVTEGRIGMVEVNGKYYVVVDVEVTEENTFEPIRPASDDDDDSEDDTIPGVTVDENNLLTVNVAELGLDGNDIDADAIINKIHAQAGTEYDRNHIKAVILPEGLESIGNSAFADCKSLETVTLPSTVTTIAGSAFYECTSLTNINLPEGLQRIGDLAFQNCTSLKEINLNGCTSLESISGGAFAKSGLTEIDLSNCTNLKIIGNSAFWGCTSLTSIDLRNTQVNKIDSGAFSGCIKLGTVLLPERLTTIGSKAFYNCTDLQSIYFQSVPTSILHDAFDGVKASGLTVYYSSACDLTALQEALRNKGFSGDFNKLEFKEGLPPLPYLLGL